MNIQLSEEEISILENALVSEITALCKQRVVYDIGWYEREKLEKKIANAKALLKALSDRSGE